MSSDTDWIYDDKKAVVAKPRQASKKRRPKALIRAERALSLPQRFYVRLLVESETIAIAERRMSDAGYNFNRATYYRWRQHPNFIAALNETQDWMFKAHGITKERLMLDAEKIKQNALEERPILYKGDDTGFKEQELGTALRAVEFQGKGLGITDPDQRGVKVNIDIDFSGRAAGVTIEGDSETLAVE